MSEVVRYKKALLNNVHILAVDVGLHYDINSIGGLNVVPFDGCISRIFCVGLCVRIYTDEKRHRRTV